jgi:hypothetical protein
MKPSEWEQLGLALRREKAIQTKWQPARGAGCARNSTASGGGRKISLDIPFYRTFSPASASVYQLGDFGTASKKLKDLDLKQ